MTTTQGRPRKMYYKLMYERVCFNACNDVKRRRPEQLIDTYVIRRRVAHNTGTIRVIKRVYSNSNNVSRYTDGGVETSLSITTAVTQTRV